MGETGHAARWAVTVDGNVEYYPSFEEAVDAFAEKVMRHMDEWPDCYEDCMPAYSYLGYMVHPETEPLSDGEILAEARLRMACRPLGQAGRLRICPNGMPPVLDEDSHPIRFHRHVEGIEADVDVEISQDDTQVCAKVVVDDEGDIHTFETNAPYFTRDDIVYFFRSNQRIITSSERGRCGAECSIDASLRKVA